jgi:hypothetical protein
MWRDEQTNINKQEIEQTNKKLQVQEQQSFSLSVLVLLLQHPILVLVFKQKLCCNLIR